MTICRFYQQGSCNYGDRCRFEHIKPQNYQQNYQQNHQQHNQDRYRPQPSQNSGTGGFSFTKTLQHQSNDSSFGRRNANEQNFNYNQRPPQYNQNFNQQNYRDSHQNQQNYRDSHQNQQNDRYQQQNQRNYHDSQPQNQRNHQGFQQQQQQQSTNAPVFSFTKVLQSAQNSGSLAAASQGVSRFAPQGDAGFFEQVPSYPRMEEMGGSFPPASGASFFTHASGFSSFGHATSGKDSASGGVGGGRGESMPANASVSVGASDKISNDASVYSQLSNLSRQEVECFESDSFCFTRIPVKSPPAQFCT